MKSPPAYAPQVAAYRNTADGNDASDRPGMILRKGCRVVTAVLSELVPPGFKNVLDAGHKRVFQRLA